MIRLFVVLVCLVYASHNAFGGLLLHLKFDEVSGNTAYDSSGNSYHGSLHNFASTGWVDGVLGGALKFVGRDANQSINFNSSERIQIANVPNLGSSFSIATWYSRGVDADPAYNSIYSRGTTWLTDLLSEDKLRGYTSFADANGYATGFGFDPSDNEWRHIALTYDNEDVKVYSNGSLIGSRTLDSNSSNSTSDIYIGTRQGVLYSLGGRLDDYRIYDHVLSANEINSLSIVPAPEPAEVFVYLSLTVSSIFAFRNFCVKRKQTNLIKISS